MDTDGTDAAQIEATHVAYTDETRYNVGRVRGLGMVSARLADAPALGGEVRRLLDESGVRECKWEHVRRARDTFAAAKLLDWAIERAIAGRLRVDTLTWEPDNPADAERQLPYMQRLHRMYARLVGDILPQRWPSGARFQVVPDEQQALNWERITAGQAHIAEIAQAQSDAEPLVQVADLFAGLAAYSRDGYDTYEGWLSEGRVFSPALSASDRYRVRLLDDFFTACTYRGLRVSLRTHRGLRTYGAAPPLCFWWGEAL